MDADTKMDEISALVACSELVGKYPDLSMKIMGDVVQACGQDYRKAYLVLCEMVIPADASTKTDVVPTKAAGASLPRASEASFAGVSDNLYDDETLTNEYSTRNTTSGYSAFYESARESAGLPHRTEDSVPAPLPTAKGNHSLRGAWAQKSIGRTFRVDEMCKKYQWMRRDVVKDLFRKYEDCIELVENDILMMFPVDEPAAFGGGFGETQASPSFTGPGMGRHGKRQSPHQEAIAESLREQAAEEIQRESIAGSNASLSSSDTMVTLRQQLWQTRDERARLQHLANSTRKPAHIAEAKDKDCQLRRLSAYLLERIRNSQEYRNDCIDLHGLTKEEAITLVNWKLEDAGNRRFRVITGRGIHSHNGRAVLGPALEKHFQSMGISFSSYDDGIMTVVPKKMRIRATDEEG